MKLPQEMTVEVIIAMAMADVDIFLLKEEDQKTDKNKLYSTQEIRNQLEASGSKILMALRKQGLIPNKRFDVIKC